MGDEDWAEMKPGTLASIQGLSSSTTLQKRLVGSKEKG